jgi:hypothetical protein
MWEEVVHLGIHVGRDKQIRFVLVLALATSLGDQGLFCFGGPQNKIANSSRNPKVPTAVNR